MVSIKSCTVAIILLLMLVFQIYDKNIVQLRGKTK